MLEQLLSLPGFLYEVNGHYYYFGKWICKKCTETDATDCVTMYQMCRAAHEEPETNMYFQKIRAFSDFALEIPYNPAKIKQEMKELLDSMDDTSSRKLKEQIGAFEEDRKKYC